MVMFLHILHLMIKWAATVILTYCIKMGCAASTNQEPITQQVEGKWSSRLQQRCAISSMLTMTITHSLADAASQQLTSFPKINQKITIETSPISAEQPIKHNKEFSLPKKNMLKTRKMSFDTIYEVSQQYWCSDADRYSGQEKKQEDLHELQTGCLCNQQEMPEDQNMQKQQVLPMLCIFLPKTAINPHFQPHS